MHTSIVPLSLKLPQDYAWRVGLAQALEQFVESLPDGRAKVPRFTGYYFIQNQPMGQIGELTVALPAEHPIRVLQTLVGQETKNLFSITSEATSVGPIYMLVHDRYDGACHLITFTAGGAFLQRDSAVIPSNSDGNGPSW